MTRYAMFGILLLGACSSGVSEKSAGPTPPGLVRNERQSLYAIEGTSAEELLDAMLTRGPRIAGRPMFAANQWDVKWQINPVRSARQCYIESVDVELNMRTTLPRWIATADAPEELREEWSAFLAAVDVHELGHRELGVRAASDVLGALRVLRYARATTCDGIIGDAVTAAARTLERYQRQNLQYEIDTGYGATQGVKWPR